MAETALPTLRIRCPECRTVLKISVGSRPSCPGCGFAGRAKPSVPLVETEPVSSGSETWAEPEGEAVWGEPEAEWDAPAEPASWDAAPATFDEGPESWAPVDEPAAPPEPWPEEDKPRKKGLFRRKA